MSTSKINTITITKPVSKKPATTSTTSSAVFSSGQPPEGKNVELKNKLFVKWDEFEVWRINCKELQPGTNETHFAEIQYNYGTVEKPILKAFSMELPKMTTWGLKTETDKWNKTKTKTRVSLDRSNPDHMKLIDVLKTIHSLFVDFIIANAGLFQLTVFKGVDPKDIVTQDNFFPLRKFVWIPMKGEEEDLEKSPGLWLEFLDVMGTSKSKEGKSPPKKERYTSKFIGLNNKSIDIDTLTNVKMDFIPLMRFNRIVTNPKPAVKMTVISSIVYKLYEKLSSQNVQQSTLRDIELSEPDTVSAFEASADKILGSDGVSESEVSLRTEEDSSSLFALNT